MAYTIDVHLSPEDVRSQMLVDALKGLQGEDKSIPPVWFYDERGSPLVRRDHPAARVLPHSGRTWRFCRSTPLLSLSCRRPTRSWSSAPEPARRPARCSTALEETGLLSRYVPFDVSDEFLRGVAATLAEEFDSLDIHVVIGDFHHHLAEIPTEGRRMIVFLGGTIGNLNPIQRARFLFDLNCTMSSDDSVLIGTDLVKDKSRLVVAYDDAAGVTADFNRNVLHVLNEQLGGDFDPDRFRTSPCGTRTSNGSRCDSGPTKRARSSLTEAGITVQFDQDEDLLTEISAKFTPERVDTRALRRRLRGRGDVGCGRRRVPPDPGAPILLNPADADSADTPPAPPFRRPLPPSRTARAARRGRRLPTAARGGVSTQTLQQKPRAAPPCPGWRTLASRRCGGR